jgi:ArsR family transcriptional regulator, arsenate/arsenite/antimonite-responsive transcriptional repressor
MMQTKQLASIFGSLGQVTRLEILKLLAPLSRKEGGTGMAAGKIAEVLDVSSPTLSFHLKDMALRDILIQKRIGREVHYIVNHKLLLSALEGLVIKLES